MQFDARTANTEGSFEPASSTGNDISGLSANNLTYDPNWDRPSTNSGGKPYECPIDLDKPGPVDQGKDKNPDTNRSTTFGKTPNELSFGTIFDEIDKHVNKSVKPSKVAVLDTQICIPMVVFDNCWGRPYKE